MNRNREISNTGRPKDVLLIESDPDDATRFVGAADDTHATVHVVADDDTALDFLYRRDEYVDAPQPDIVLLDLDAAAVRKDKSGLLSTIKDGSVLRRIPVIVLADSDAEVNVVRSYDLRANAFLQKPADPDEFEQFVHDFAEFWLSIVQLPPKVPTDETTPLAPLE